MKLMRVTDPESVFKIIEENFFPLEPEEIGIEEAGGRILAEDVVSEEDIPGFNRSTVDGYAVDARETFGAGEGIPSFLKCKAEILMGQAAPAISPGECCLIHTGGMLPEGADAVVMVEDTEVTGDSVNIYRQVAPGENVIRRGEDLVKGAAALTAGRRLRAPETGLLASMGVTGVRVYRHPVMGLLSSGDELVPYNTELPGPGRVRDCNTPALMQMGRQAGADVISGGILPDVYGEFFENSRMMLDNVDFLVLSGGSSVGTRDFTARTLQELGEPGLLVEGISIQPGKPTLLANCGGKPVLGLPGHPVSALNVFMLFGKAVLNRLSGRTGESWLPAIDAVLARNIPSRPGRTDYVRVKLVREEGNIAAVPVFGRSGMLRTLAEADGFVVISPEKEGLPEGENVKVYLPD